MTQTSPATAPSWRTRLKTARRRSIKAVGKRLIRGLANFLGRQSLIGDTPVLDSAHFPFLQSFTGNWQAIRAEAEHILTFREAIPAFQEISPDQVRIATGKNWRTWKPFPICKPPGSRSSAPAITSPPIAASARASSAPISALSFPRTPKPAASASAT